MDKFTAKDARKMSDDNLKGPVIEKYINHIDNRIKKAAKEGKTSIHNPQAGSANEGFDFYLGGDRFAAVERYYISIGYVIKDHPDPDPGHPCSSPYTTLSWQI